MSAAPATAVPWTLPRTWCWVSLEDIAETSSGGTPSRTKPEFYGGSIPWVKSGELRDRTIFEAEEQITERGLASSSAKLFPKGTLCVALYGATVGRLGILGIEAATNQAVCGIFLSGKVNSRFIFHFLELQRPQLIRQSAGGAQPNISQALVRKILIPLAPYAEQNRIIGELEKQFTRLDAAVAALKRVKANLKRYRASVLKAACEGRLVPTEAELARRESRSYEPASELLKRILAERRARWEADQLAKFRAADKEPKDDKWKGRYREPSIPNIVNLPKLPNGWAHVSAEQCTSLITDGEHITPPRTDSGVLLLSARNILDGKLCLDKVDYVSESTYEELAKRLRVAPGDVLLSCSGSVGRSCVAPEHLNFSLVRSVAVLRPLLCAGDYLSFALRSDFLQAQIGEKKTQTAQSNIFQGKIKTLLFPLPPFKEQGRIVAEVERRFSVIDELEMQVEANLKRAERLRQAILKHAFEGKLVPQNPDDEPVSILLERIHAERKAMSTSNNSLNRARKVAVK